MPCLPKCHVNAAAGKSLPDTGNLKCQGGCGWDKAAEPLQRSSALPTSLGASAGALACAVHTGRWKHDLGEQFGLQVQIQSEAGCKTDALQQSGSCACTSVLCSCPSTLWPQSCSIAREEGTSSAGWRAVEAAVPVERGLAPPELSLCSSVCKVGASQQEMRGKILYLGSHMYVYMGERT